MTLALSGRCFSYMPPIPAFRALKTASNGTLGGEKCHGQNELEPFPFPGGNAAVQSARAQQEQGSMGSCPLLIHELRYLTNM